jgi:hypothetical protein
MAASVQLGYAAWQDGMTLNGQLGRTLDVAALHATAGTTSALTVQSGVISSVGGMQVVPVSGLSIAVNAGFCVIANSSSNLQGAYRMGSMQSNGLTVSTADPTNPRIDLVCATVSDPGTAAGFSEIQIIAGTPAVSPVAPSLPANSLSLATISVPATTVSITSGLITDTRTYTSTSGGATNWVSVGSSGPGFTGLVAYDRTNDRFFHNNGGSGAGSKLKTLPWQPVISSVATSGTLPSGHFGTILSASITTDGSTDIKISAQWCGLSTTNNVVNATWQYQFIWAIDGTTVCQRYENPPTNIATIISNGGTHTYSTSSTTGDTPSAGSHTVSWQAQCFARGGANGTPSLVAAATAPATLRVEPVNA